MSKKKPVNIPVGKRALVQQINRALKHEVLKQVRSPRASNFGDYYTVYTVGTQGVARSGIEDLEAFAREVGALAPHECYDPPK